jgi:hypothetical protein
MLEIGILAADRFYREMAALVKSEKIQLRPNGPRTPG